MLSSTDVSVLRCWNRQTARSELNVVLLGGHSTGCAGCKQKKAGHRKDKCPWWHAEEAAKSDKVTVFHASTFSAAQTNLSDRRTAICVTMMHRRRKPPRSSTSARSTPFTDSSSKRPERSPTLSRPSQSLWHTAWFVHVPCLPPRTHKVYCHGVADGAATDNGRCCR
jgi:hypothetical protein